MPANMPIGLGRTVRGDAVRRVPGTVSGVGLPRFCMTGELAPALSPTWAVDGTIPVAEMFIVLEVGTDVELDVIVNGVSVWTDSFDLTTSNGWAPSSPFTLFLNDGVQIELIAFTAGAEGLTVVLRPDLGSSGLLN
jgi:hypothetical protein